MPEGSNVTRCVTGPSGPCGAPRGPSAPVGPAGVKAAPEREQLICTVIVGGTSIVRVYGSESKKADVICDVVHCVENKTDIVLRGNLYVEANLIGAANG